MNATEGYRAASTFVTEPSPATLAMAKLGYDSYKQDVEDCKKTK